MSERRDDDLEPVTPDLSLDAAGPETPESADEAYRRFVETNLKSNYIAHFAHGMLGMTGFRLIYAPTFVPAYLYMLTGSPLMVGLGQALQQLGAILSPLISANQIEHRRKVLPAAVTIGLMMRVQLLGLALAGWFLVGTPLVVATILFLFLLGFFQGSQRVAFQTLLAKVIPIDRRGRLQAWRNLAGGAIAAALSWWAGSTLIERNVLGNGYATTFMLAFILTSLGLVVLSRFMREPESHLVRQRTRLIERVRDFPAMLADRDYRNFLIVQVLTTAGRISLPFGIIHASEKLPLNGATIGLLSLAFLGADTLANLAWGALGDRRGFKSVYLLSVGIWLGALGLMMTAASEQAFLIAFAGLGAAMSGYMMAAQTLVLEFGSREDMPMRLALSTTAETSIATAGPLLGGVLATIAGLQSVFIVSIAFLSAALLMLLFAVREPRYRTSA